MEQMKEISDKLDVLIRISAANIVQGKPFKAQVQLLNSVGIKPKDIAALLNKTSNHVNVTLHGLRKESMKQSQEESEFSEPRGP